MAIVSPGVGALTLGPLKPRKIAGPGLFLIGEVPTIVQTRHHIVEPDVGSLSLTPLAPVIIIGHVALPNIDTLVLTGLAPVEAAITHIRGPPIGSLALTGNAPTLASVIPADVGSLSLSGLAPSAEITHIRTPDAGSLSLSGLQPSSEIDHIRVPTNGSLSLTGLVPTIAVSSGADVTEEPGAGSLTLNGLVPSAEITHIRVPATGSLSLTGLTPIELHGPGLLLTGFVPTVSVSGDLVVGPGVGALTLTPQQPTAPLSNTIVTPATGSLSLTGNIPFADIGASNVVQVGVGSLTLSGLRSDFINSGDNRLILTGYAPFASIGNPEQPGTASLTLTGFAPFPQVSFNPLVVNPDIGSLSLTPNQPITLRDLTVDPTTGSISLSGLTPGIAISANGVSFPGQASLALNGLSPTVVIGAVARVAEPGPASLSLSGQVPATVNTSPTPIIRLSEIGSLVLVGQQPSVEIEHFKEVPVGSLTLKGKGPQVIIRGKTKGRVKKKKRYVVEIDNQLFEVASPQEAEKLLLQVRELAQEQAKTEPVSQPTISVRTIGGAKTKSKVIQTAVRDTKKAIRLINERANERIRRDAEISRILHSKIDSEDEEAAILALLL